MANQTHATTFAAWSFVQDVHLARVDEVLSDTCRTGTPAIDMMLRRWRHAGRGRAALHRQIGKDRAVIVGDLLLAWGGSIVSSVGARQAQVWNDALCRLSLGQHAEFDLRGRLDTTEDQLIGYLGNKTAALLSASCELGAICAQSAPVDVAAAARFGYEFGITFQMIDDLLDIIGDERTINKLVQQDIPTGVYTVTVLAALVGGQPAAVRRLRKALRSGRAERAYDLVRASEGIERAISLIHDYAARAARTLQGASMSEQMHRLACLPHDYAEEALHSQTAPEYRQRPLNSSPG